MSGIEAAGIVLAVLGVLIQGVGGYKEVVTGRDVNLLVESLKDNKMMFSNAVEYLLRSVVPPDELTRLLNDPSGDPWRDADLKQRVMAHLGPDAGSILQKIYDIRRTVEQLQKKLPAQQDDANVVARARHVIKCFVRGPFYSASLDRLRTRISEFRTLTNDALKLAKARGTSSHIVQDLSIVQRCASWLHDALKGGWKCTCEDSHPANIQLDTWSLHAAAENKRDVVGVHFSLLFAESVQQAQHDHWMTAEITTSRSSLNEVRPMLVRALSNTQVSSSTVQSVPSITPLLAQSSPTSASSLTISTTAHVNSGNPGSPQCSNDDLCHIIKSPTVPPRTTRKRLGSISDKSGHNYDLFTRTDVVKTNPSMTLAEVYRKQSVLSNRNRVQLALTLAWGVLQISTTSWLNGKWTKDHIFLVMEAPNNPLPYLSHRFESSRRDSLLSSTLSPITVDQVGDWVGNTSLFALGVFLLEMCFDCPIEDLATAKEKNERGDAFDHTPILTARRLAILAQDQLGICYAQAVNACLNFPHIAMDADGKPVDFPEFAKIVLRDIIDPLKTAAKSYVQ